MLRKTTSLFLTAVCLISAGLCYYSSVESTDYFLSAQQAQERELVRQHAVTYAQTMGNRGLILAECEAARSQRFEKERDEAREVAVDLMRANGQLRAYIHKLLKALGEANAPIPPAHQPEPTPADKTTFLQQPLSNSPS